MIRLFKQVYLSPDSLFNWSSDRITLSKNVGASMAHQLDEVVRGDSYYYSEGWDPEDLPFDKLIEHAEEHCKENSPLVIWADEDAFPKLLVQWIRTIAPNATVDHVHQFYQSEYFSSIYIHGRTGDDQAINHQFGYPNFDKKAFEDNWDIQEVPQTFLAWIEDNAEHFELAFLLATYVSTGQYKDRVEKFFMRNVRHFVDLHMYDIKREVSKKILYDDFSDKMGCQRYTLETLEQIGNDKSPLMEVLFGERIYKSRVLHNSNKMNKEGLNIIWENVTEEDIDNVCRIIDIAKISIGVESIEEFKWIFSVATKGELSDNDLDRMLEREQRIKRTDVKEIDALIDGDICAALYIQHMLQQDDQYIDNLKIV